MLLTAVTADPLGRFSALSLSQQSLMEMLVQDFSDVKIAKDADGAFFDIKEWSVLRIDENGDIVAIYIDAEDADFFDVPSIKERSFDAGGSIDFQYVPQTVQFLDLGCMMLEGQLETSILPSVLDNLSVGGNRLKGTFDIKGLPKGMEYINIPANKLHGSLAMDCLPSPMEIFNAWDNEFSGTVNLTELSPMLKKLSLSFNRLEGPLVLLNVPPALKDVELHNNSFDTEKVVLDAKHTMKRFKVDRCFMGKVFDGNGVENTQQNLEFPREVVRKPVEEVDECGLFGDDDPFGFGSDDDAGASE